MKRRDAIKFAFSALSIGFGGFFILKNNLNAKSFLLLRPPGAKSEKEFLASCIRCGLCVVACPFDTLELANLNDNIPNGTPFFVPRNIPCYMCVDIPCTAICPTDALQKSKLESNGKLDINKAKMGVAVIDDAHCVAYWGVQCDACYRACPLIDKALKLEYKRNDRTGKHAKLIPVLDTEICTGCGKCEHACITKKAAISVVPSEFVVGSVDTNYIKGWDRSDEVRLQDAKKQESKSKNTLQYLNSDEF